MSETIELREVFKATPQQIYNAWLNSESHAQMTGAEANCSNVVGASFTAWEGYISGRNIELLQNEKIVQSWRTSEFSDNDADSILTIIINESYEGTELLLTHKNIPKGQLQYKKGWLDHYFVPMKDFFKQGFQKA